MLTTVYNFLDVKVNIKHKALGQITQETYLAAESVGSIATAMSTDRTAHDVAADGSVMVSKIRARNGTIAITTQQTSILHKWLLKWFNYLETHNSNEWAETTILIESATETIYASGVTPTKQPDMSYQAQGQSVTWNLMAADMVRNAL